MLVFLGSGVGGVGRFLLGVLIERRIDSGLDAALLATLGANLLGSALIGVIFAGCERDWLRILLMVGVLGGFTTFSAFSMQAVQLLHDGLWPKALGYVVLSTLLCLGGSAAGYALGRGLA